MIQFLLVALSVTGLAVAEIASGDLTSNEIVTKLSPKKSLEGYARYAKANPINDVHTQTADSEDDVQIVLLGKDDQSRDIIQGFVHNNSPDSVKGLFIVKDENEKQIIQRILHQKGEFSGSNALQIIKFHQAKDIIEELVRQEGGAEEIKAVMIVKDSRAKTAFQELLKNDPTKKDVKVILVGKDEKAKEIIDKFLDKSSQSSLPETSDKDLQEHNRKKDEQAKDLIKQIFPSPESSAKDMMRDLLGQDEKVKKVLAAMPNMDADVKSMVQGLLGYDDRIHIIMNVFQNYLDKIPPYRPIPLSAIERAKDVNSLLSPNSPSTDSSPAGGPPIEKVSGCQIVASQTETKKTADSVEWLHKHLKSYIQGALFDYASFETMGQALEQKIGELDSRVGYVAECDPSLIIKLKYIRSMFQLMSDSIELLKYYHETDLEGHDLVYQMVDLNVRLLTLLDSSGEPDRQIYGFSENLAMFFQQMNAWANEFTSIRSMPYGRQRFFNKQFMQAQATLIMFARHVGNLNANGN